MSTNSKSILLSEDEINLIFDALDKHTIQPVLSDVFEVSSKRFGHHSFVDDLLKNIDTSKEKFDAMQRENKQKVRKLQGRLVDLIKQPQASESAESTTADEASNA